MPLRHPPWAHSAEIALVFLQPDGSHETYTGPLKALPLRGFLDSHASSEAVAGGTAGVAAGSEGLMEPVLHSLTSDNLTDMGSKDDMWLVAFYSVQGGLPLAARTCCFCCLEHFVKLYNTRQLCNWIDTKPAADMDV